MAIPRLGGTGLPLGNNGLYNPQGSANSASGTVSRQQAVPAGFTNAISLQPGCIYQIPAGTYMVMPGPYTFLQWLDPVTNSYRPRPTGTTNVHFIDSDGSNYRLANTTGFAMGAVIIGEGTTGTNGIGTATTGVTITPSAGGSVWSPIVGGAVATTVVTGTVGAGYNYIPQVVIDAPPVGGWQATARCTALSTGTVTAANITIDNQGAGYSTAPTMTIIPDPRDTTGPTITATHTVTLTGTGGLTGVVVTNHGTATATSLPTLTITGTTATATVIMNWTVTGFATASTVGAGYPGNAPIVSVGNNIVATSVRTNPLHTTGLTQPRPARIVTASSATTIITTGSIIEDAGLGIQAVPLLVVSAQGTTITTPTATVGSAVDTSYIQNI